MAFLRTLVATLVVEMPVLQSISQSINQATNISNEALRRWCRLDADVVRERIGLGAKPIQSLRTNLPRRHATEANRAHRLLKTLTTTPHR